MSDLGVLVPVAAILAWPLSIAARAFTRRAGTDTSLAQVDARLARLEQAVDTIASEVERVAEGQRFTAAVLADRPPLERPTVPLAAGPDAAGPPSIPR